MAVADLTITERREKVVDFSVPYMYYTQEMLLKKTASSKTVHLLQFLNPFENHVWLATIASLVVISIAVFVINYFSPYGYKDDNGRGTSQEFSFFNSMWFALACMLQQGADHSPRSFSGKENCSLRLLWGLTSSKLALSCPRLRNLKKVLTHSNCHLTRLLVFYLTF